MKAIKIDPFAQTIEEVEMDDGLDSYYKNLDTPVARVDVFTTVRLNKEMDFLYVDDNGLTHIPRTKLFTVKGYPAPLAGNGLILGADQMGNTLSPSVTLDWVKKNVTFLGSFPPPNF